MAQEILNNLLDFKISPKELLEWLTTDDYSVSKNIEVFFN